MMRDELGRLAGALAAAHEVPARAVHDAEARIIELLDEADR